MLYFLASLLLILSGLTFAFSSPLFDVSTSEAWLASALAFGLIASSLPVLRAKRTLKDAMIAIALFAIYTAGMISVRDGFRRRPQNQIYSYTNSR
jgi:hypothetical protein